MPIRFSQEGLARQAALVRDVEPEYFAWIDRALRALPSEPPEPIVSVEDLGAFVRGEGYADYWRQKYDMHVGGFPIINGVNAYEATHVDTIAERWDAWRDAHGPRTNETGRRVRPSEPAGRRKRTWPRKPRSEIGLYTRLSLPPELPASAGYRAIPGMELMVQEACVLWAHAPTPPPLTTKKLGLVGSLGQAWVAHVAVQELPQLLEADTARLPEEFYAQHPQEIMAVHVRVFQFDNAAAPRALLAHPDFTDRGQTVTDDRVRPYSGTILGGLAFHQIGHDGEPPSYTWDWADREFFKEVRVVGFNLPGETARTLALSMGKGTASDPGL